MKEAAALYPQTLDVLETWCAPWYTDNLAASTARQQVALDPGQRAAQALLHTFPSTTNTMAASHGLALEWHTVAESTAAVVIVAPNANVTALLQDYPDTLAALATA